MRSLLLEDLPLVLAPDVHELAGLVHLHGVVHQAVHVDELDPPLLRVVHHGRDDGQLPHLLLVVLEGRRGGVRLVRVRRVKVGTGRGVGGG